ncbi:MAG TPA: type II toxin-antitoxin system prevent-host-death family antitoxin [Rhodoblastus sp.]|nr:type II toxin-antitoxin system prevent-host-death family antitoxin [Rhodoblastus sp.]
MSSYSVAYAKEQLSKLIDEALAGESVVITRHGKPVVELRPKVAPPQRKKVDVEWLRKRREALPPLGENAVDILRRLRDGDE